MEPRVEYVCSLAFPANDMGMWWQRQRRWPDALEILFRLIELNIWYDRAAETRRTQQTMREWTCNYLVGE